MRSPVLPLILLSTLAVPAHAEDIVGPDAISPSGVAFPCQTSGGTGDFWTCLAAAGAPPPAIAFAQHLNDSLGTPGLLVEFREMGAVDLGTVLFPFLANTNQQELLLNGDEGVLQPDTMVVAPPQDSGTRALRTAHPEAFLASRVAVAGYLGDGRQQRFVLSDEVVDGCRACAPVGMAISVVEFRDGAMVGAQSMGWVAPELGGDDARALALRHGEAGALQVALALHGYDPGPLGGADSAATEAALARFLRDNCLDPAGGLSPEALALLTAPGPYLASPACLSLD